MLLVWLHLLALAVFLGALSCLWIMVLSPLSTIESATDRLTFFIRCLKVYNPLQIGALGVLLMTGAFRLTSLKAGYGVQFSAALGGTLALKLGLAFIVIIVSTYQCMGIAHRFVRRAEQPDADPLPDMGPIVRKLKFSTVLILVFALWTVLVGMEIPG